MADISKITLPNGSSYNIKDATARTELAGKAAASHTHNYAGSTSAGGAANKAVELADYKDTNSSVKVGFAGPSLTTDEFTYFAGYTSKDSTNAARIKDVSVDTVKSKLGLKSAAYSETSAFAAASHPHTKSQITDFPTSLPASDVYTWAKASTKPSYSWSEITGKPTIPSVGNGTVTIKQAGSTKGTFTMNQSGNTTIELTDNDTHPANIILSSMVTTDISSN